MEVWVYGDVDLGSWSWSKVGLKVVIFPRLCFSKLGCGLSIGFGYFSSVKRESDKYNLRRRGLWTGLAFALGWDKVVNVLKLEYGLSCFGSLDSI